MLYEDPNSPAQVDSSQEHQNKIEMLKKIKKARDLVFTTAKRRSRRSAIASQDTARDQEAI